MGAGASINSVNQRISSLSSNDNDVTSTISRISALPTANQLSLVNSVETQLTTFEQAEAESQAQRQREEQEAEAQRQREEEEKRRREEQEANNTNNNNNNNTGNGFNGYEEIRIHFHSGRSFRATDGRRGRGDPYIYVQTVGPNGEEGEQLTSSTVRNNHRTPSWDEEIILGGETNPAVDQGSGQLTLQVWDQDTSRGPRPGGGRDDLLGALEFDLSDAEFLSGGFNNRTMDLTGNRAQGTLTLSIVTVLKPAPPPSTTNNNNSPQAPSTNINTTPVVPPVVDEHDVHVIRKEIREMSSREQERFLNALNRMMENGDYFRLAGYHGWPNDYCAHRQEVFPHWHRAYLCDVERSLIRADMDLGNDGNVGLPYWDWTRPTINGQVVPNLIRDNFGQIPSALQSQIRSVAGGSTLINRGYQLSRDSTITRRLRSSFVNSKVNEALLQPQHWRAASTEWSAGASIETSHNDIHVACGYPMTSVNYAAFHPIFFLHHCNVDRIYERYLTIETDSRLEFAARQRSLVEQRSSRTNRFTAPLEPFFHPVRPNEPIMASDTFDIQGLGYSYDALPPRPSRRLRAVPTYAVFKDIDPVKLKPNSYFLHVFVVRKGDTDSFQPPNTFDELETALETHAHFAGTASIFGGKGSECATCRESEPISLLVDISNKIGSLYDGTLKRETSELIIICEKHDPTLENATKPEIFVLPITMTDDLQISFPTIEGPFFEDPAAMLQKGATADAHFDSLHLQQYLKVIGYYKGKLDGEFGPITEAAVKAFQEFNGLEVDGIAGPITKKQILAPRNDLVEDAESGNSVKLKGNIVLRYWVGTPPGYLSRTLCIREIENCFKKWSDAITALNIDGLSLTCVHVHKKEELPGFGKDFRKIEGKEHDGEKKGEESNNNNNDNAPLMGVEIDWMDNSMHPGNIQKFDGIGGMLAHADATHIHLDMAERWVLQGMKGRPDSFFLLPVVLHEIGHVLGLKHLSSPEAVMGPYYNSTHINLTEADMDYFKKVHMRKNV